jgi:hypothetical protein
MLFNQVRHQHFTLRAVRCQRQAIDGLLAFRFRIPHLHA